MISDSLSCLGRYLGIHPALDTAIRWQIGRAHV